MHPGPTPERSFDSPAVPLRAARRRPLIIATAIAAITYGALPLVDYGARVMASNLAPAMPGWLFDPIVPSGLLLVFALLAGFGARWSSHGWIWRTSLVSGVAAGVGIGLGRFTNDLASWHSSGYSFPPSPSSLIECYHSCFPTDAYIAAALWSAPIVAMLAVPVGLLARRVPARNWRAR